MFAPTWLISGFSRFSSTWINPLVISLAAAYLRLWLLSSGFFTLAFVISRWFHLTFTFAWHPTFWQDAVGSFFSRLQHIFTSHDAVVRFWSSGLRTSGLCYASHQSRQMQMVPRCQCRLFWPNAAIETKSVASEEIHVRVVLLFLQFADF